MKSKHEIDKDFDNALDKLSEIMEKEDNIIEKLKSYLLKYHDKIFTLCDSLSKIKCCPRDCGIELDRCPKTRCMIEQGFLSCWKEWINSEK